MTHDDIKKLNDSLSDMLSEREIDDALYEIEEECKRTGFHDLARQTRRLADDYGYMLDYFSQGSDDPTRMEMFDHIYSESWTLLDTLIDHLERETSDAQYYTSLRMLAERRLDLPMLAERFIADSHAISQIPDDARRLKAAEELDGLAETLWLAIWTNFPSCDEDRQAIETVLTSPDVAPWYRATFLSAQTLALLTFFDASKADLLFRLVQSEATSIEMKTRAVVGALLVSLKYTYRIDHLPGLQERIDQLLSDTSLSDSNSLFLQIQTQILQAPEADTATRKMNEEIAPELRKGLGEIQRRREEQKKARRHGKSDERQEHDEDIEHNPEWASAINTDRLKSHIIDFLKMQAEGTDVMLDAFAFMSRQPFFNALSHWFLPFDINQPWIQRLILKTPGMEQVIRMMSQVTNFSDTDKQSHFLGLANMADEHRQALIQQLREKGIAEVFDESVPPQAPVDISRHYLHDLYRFFRTAPHCQEWENPFDDRDLLDFGASPYLEKAVHSMEATQYIARYLFDKQRWNEAIPALQRWLERDNSEEALQKLAYAACQKGVEDLSLAHEALVTCNALYPDKEWTLRYLAQFYIRSEEYASAELLLDHACEIYPDDTDFLNKYASVLIAQRRFKEAFEPLYKADLLKEGQPRTLRNLAWCNFMLSRGDKAEQYIKRLLERKPTRTDWLNGGHIALQAGNIRLALQRYGHCFDRGRWTLKEFEDAVYDDWMSLLDAGVRDVDITLTLDVIRRTIPSEGHQHTKE